MSRDNEVVLVYAQNRRKYIESWIRLEVIHLTFGPQLALHDDITLDSYAASLSNQPGLIGRLLNE